MRPGIARRQILIASAVVLVGAASLLVLLRSREYDAQPERFWRTGDSFQIVALINVGIGDEVVGRNVTEDAGTVRISLRVRENFSNKPALGVVIPVAVTLKQPLRDRVVADATGRVVPEITPPGYGAPP
jgi:hypothetical protein